MVQLDRELLGQFAAKYIWWKTPGEALRFPERVIAQVMDIGDYDDVQKLVAQVAAADRMIRVEHAGYRPIAALPR